jgi:hypothetical protein
VTFPIRQFPLLGSIWNVGHTPATTLPDLTNVPMQLYVDPHQSLVPSFYNANGQPWNWFLQIFMSEGVWTASRGSIIAPDHSVAEYYYVMWAEHYFKGFPQAYYGVIVLQCNANATNPRTY